MTRISLIQSLGYHGELSGLSIRCSMPGFLPTPHYCDAVAFGYLIPPCQRLIGDFHPSYVSCLTYYKSRTRHEQRASVYQIQIKLFIIVMNTTAIAAGAALLLLPECCCAVQMVHGA